MNPRSSKQVKEYFGTVSSDKATLTRIAIEGKLTAAKEYSAKVRVKARDAQNFTEEQQVVAELVLNARKARNDISKLTGYVGNSKMYGRFKPIGTSTSRWSCSGTPKGSSRPELFNAQNYSRDFKAVFGVKPESGLIIVAADFATLELRIAACIMNEPNMYHALMRGDDLHKTTASLIFDKPLDQISGKERSNAKVCNFGLTYGMGQETFKHYAYDMYGLKLSNDEAKDLISRFFKAYPGLKAYHQMVGKRMKSKNYVCKTALDFPMKPKMYAEAINGPTQGTGGEVMRLAIHKMVQTDPETLKVMVNSIHDAAYLIVPEKDKDYWGKLLSDSMQEAWFQIRKSKHFRWHDIPMPVDLMSGYTMGDLEEGFAGGGQALTLEEMRVAKERIKNAV
jgi:DNA polymerase-1